MPSTSANSVPVLTKRYLELFVISTNSVQAQWPSSRDPDVTATANNHAIVFDCTTQTHLKDLSLLLLETVCNLET